MSLNTPKTALITGCSEGGIGHALALEFSRRGVHVFATARTPSKMASLKDKPNITLLAMDVTSQPSINAALTAITTSKVGTDGTLDYLVNNAGGQVVMPVLDLDMEVARQMYEVNFWGMLAVIKTFSPLLIKAKGTIANLSSIGASLYMPYLGKSARTNQDMRHCTRVPGHQQTFLTFRDGYALDNGLPVIITLTNMLLSDLRKFQSRR